MLIMGPWDAPIQAWKIRLGKPNTGPIIPHREVSLFPANTGGIANGVGGGRVSKRGKQKRTVQILNSMPGDASYTSFRSARNLVRRHRAVWARGGIRLLDRVTSQRLEDQVLREMEDRATDTEIAQNRRAGMVSWRGRRRSEGNRRYLVYPPGIATS